MEWGIRYANWVTLQGIDGHVISVISAHLAPETEITDGLQTVGINNLGDPRQRARGLRAGADGRRHELPLRRDPVPARRCSRPTASPRPTTSPARHFPTGDHRGATIDYVFLKDASQFTVLGQYNQELYSDHDAVTADLAFTDAPLEVPVSFTPGIVHQRPEGTRGARRAVLDLMVKAVDNAPTGRRHPPDHRQARRQAALPRAAGPRSSAGCTCRSSRGATTRRSRSRT